ncbi:uncharacterized protein LOC116198826 isoform X2 [Punica granatum]|uniref:Uncharacterized protein LOC116198826 isoform X2 n=1 Tax=Punica granatum TaxID=22663 RepID=A0A6P8CU46_PUNGR|nr:uncharacterized protein LOC116198826 isoform X2 [Punica granatum]
MELVSADIRNWWKAWDLRLVVLFSGLLQVILVITGSRRKSINKSPLKALVWSIYLTADSVATLALGILSNRLANIKEATGKIDPNDQLIAFWSPFLLLHLGGPDTITAYSLEDNELWLRHFARLVVQTGLACYIFFLALTGSPLSVLASVMIVVGFIKYGERTLSLYLASKDQLQDSMQTPPESGPIYPRIVEQHSLSREEGYNVSVDRVIEVQAPEDLSTDGDVHDEKASDLLKASSLFQIFNLLFVDLILSLSDLGSSKSMFKDMASENAFRIIEIELSFMFDILYTKGIILYKRWGILGRIITLCLTCGVLVFFFVAEWKNYTRVDICVTFSLLGIAILLEIYSILLMVSSDWARVWALRNRNRYEAKVIDSLQFCRQPRWSNTVAQFSLLRLSLSQKPWILQNSPKLAKFYGKLQIYFNISYKPFQNNMKEWICSHLKEKAELLNPSNIRGADVRTVSSVYEAGGILRKKNHHEMTWSTDNIEFDQSILIWHIATELCHFYDRKRMRERHGEAMTNYKG